MPVSVDSKAARQGYAEISSLDQEERDRMLMENLVQVNYIARRIHDRLPQHVLLEDLVHAGIVGLLEAIRNFDPSRNVKIKTYAKLRIEGAILDSLRDLDWGPRDLRKKGRQVEQAHQKLRGTLGRAPSENELADELGLPLKALQDLLLELRGLDLGSIQALAPEGGGEEEVYYKYLPNSPEEDPLHVCLESEMKQCLAKAVGELPERERQVLALYYHEELTMKEVGAVLGVGEGRISQIHSAALLRLRARMQDLLSLRPKKKVSGSAQPQGHSGPRDGNRGRN